MESRVANGDSRLLVNIILAVCGFLASGYAMWLGWTALDHTTRLTRLEQKIDDLRGLVRGQHYAPDEAARSP